MLRISLIGAVIVALTVVIHAIGTTLWIRHIGRRYADEKFWQSRMAIAILIRTVLVVIVLHTIEIMLWAGSYMLLTPDSDLASFEQAVYFSFVTFTTLGYGDITLSEGWRILSGIEALNGILLIGWTTAMLFSVVQQMWRGLASNNDN
jgi:hypothetical protein